MVDNHPELHVKAFSMVENGWLSERTDKANKHSTHKAISIELRELKRKKRSVRQRKKRPIRRKHPARKVKERAASREVHYNPLIALLMFLYMLRLIDRKTFTRIQQALYPTKKKPKRRTRRRRTR